MLGSVHTLCNLTSQTHTHAHTHTHIDIHSLTKAAARLCQPYLSSYRSVRGLIDCFVNSILCWGSIIKRTHRYLYVYAYIENSVYSSSTHVVLLACYFIVFSRANIVLWLYIIYGVENKLKLYSVLFFLLIQCYKKGDISSQ